MIPNHQANEKKEVSVAPKDNSRIQCVCPEMDLDTGICLPLHATLSLPVSLLGNYLPSVSASLTSLP